MPGVVRGVSGHFLLTLFLFGFKCVVQSVVLLDSDCIDESFLLSVNSGFNTACYVVDTACHVDVCETVLVDEKLVCLVIVVACLAVVFAPAFAVLLLEVPFFL